MTGPLIFLDTETTGLDPDLHEVWEVAFALERGRITTFLLPHDLATADPDALRLNGYWDRFDQASVDPAADLQLKRILAGATIVGANAPFDAAFLRARWGAAPWHYRLVEVESMALGLLGYDRPKGLNHIADDLRDAGYSVPVPDHTAAGDVATLRAVYESLRVHARTRVAVR